MQNSRIPDSHADDGRAERAEAPSLSRSQAVGRLKGPDRTTFERIIQDGTRLQFEFARIYTASGSGLLGIGVSRSLGSHARRNRVRRRVRSAFFAVFGGSGAGPWGVDSVVLVKGQGGCASFAEWVALFQRFRMELEASRADLEREPGSG